MGAVAHASLETSRPGASGYQRGIGFLLSNITTGPGLWRPKISQSGINWGIHTVHAARRYLSYEYFRPALLPSPARATAGAAIQRWRPVPPYECPRTLARRGWRRRQAVARGWRRRQAGGQAVLQCRTQCCRRSCRGRSCRSMRTARVASSVLQHHPACNSAPAASTPTTTPAVPRRQWVVHRARGL